MLTLQINGQSRTLQVEDPATLGEVLEHLNIKPDRVAVEHNGDIVSRQSWTTTNVATGDRLEIVHFVGGGLTGLSKLKTTRNLNPANHYTEYVLSDVDLKS